MLATIFFSVLGTVALLAIGAMIGTWRQYGSAWDALDADLAAGKPMAVCYVASCADGPVRTCALVPALQVRTISPADRPWHVWRAAA